MAKLKVGDRVIVRLCDSDQFKNNSIRPYNNKEYTIKRVREISYGPSGAKRVTEYYLDGVESEYGIPYAFLEEYLVRL